jgi:urease beta subunit
MNPGEYLLDEESGPIVANAGRETTRLWVENTGDRPVQVGSHFHFFEVNRAFRFDRAAAYGMHLDIPAGTAARFEPGERKEVALVAFAGNRVTLGCNALVDGPLDEPGTKDAAIESLAQLGFRK